MTLYRKRPVVIDAEQWFKSGDHSQDRVGELLIDWVKAVELKPELLNEAGELVSDDAPEAAFYERREGAVVRYFRRPEPEYRGALKHSQCGHDWHSHGWIDALEGGHTVCPGDWIITGVNGERYPCKPDIFEKTYELAEGGGLGDDTDSSNQQQ